MMVESVKVSLISKLETPQAAARTNPVDTGERLNNQEQLRSRFEDREQVKEISEDRLLKELDTLNKVLAATDHNLRFKVHEELEQLYVEVVDIKTQEVVKTLPPEYLIDLSVKMKELVGLFIDEKV